MRFREPAERVAVNDERRSAAHRTVANFFQASRNNVLRAYLVKAGRYAKLIPMNINGLGVGAALYVTLDVMHRVTLTI